VCLCLLGRAVGVVVQKHLGLCLVFVGCAGGEKLGIGGGASKQK